MSDLNEIDFSGMNSSMDKVIPQYPHSQALVTASSNLKEEEEQLMKILSLDPTDITALMSKN